MSEKRVEVSSTAVHEAGHALAAHLLGMSVEFCTIEEVDDNVGTTDSYKFDCTLEERICVNLAGWCAEIVLGGLDHDTAPDGGSCHDYDMSMGLLDGASPVRARMLHLYGAQLATCKLLAAHKSALRALAAMLDRRKTISAADFRKWEKNAKRVTERADFEPP